MSCILFIQDTSYGQKKLNFDNKELISFQQSLIDDEITGSNVALIYSKGKKIYTKGDVAHFAYYVHSGQVNIYSPGGLLLGKIGEGEIFGERGPSLDESRSVTAEADTNCILYPINEKTLKQKLTEADPVVRAIVRSLLMRLNDINLKSEDFWRSLNVVTSLSDEKD